MKPHLPAWQPFRTRLSRYFLFWLAITLVSCEKCDIYPAHPKGKTEIFGQVVDEKTRLPIEGLEIIVVGTKSLIFKSTTTLQSHITDHDGRYHFILKSVPNDIRTLTIYPLYYTYKNYYNFKVDTTSSISCCPAPIGQRTEYNFELIPRQ